jgi:hypothetical protein
MNIRFETRLRNPNTRLDHFLSFLGLQLDHTANQLLDVTWIAGISDKCFMDTLQFIREKAPFSRWRTLRVFISSGLPDDVPWSSADAFPNLESLIIRGEMDRNLLSVMDCTTTSRLKVLDLSAVPFIEASDMLLSFAKSLRHTSSLLIKGFYWSSEEPVIPANVVNLHLEWAYHDPPPHVETYKIWQREFNQHRIINLRNTTTLIVEMTLVLCPYCQVVLPALRTLKLRTLRICSGAKLEAPALEVLHFMNECGPGVGALLSHTNESLLDPGLRGSSGELRCEGRGCK